MFGWLKKSPPVVAEHARRYFLLYREGHQVLAADVTYLPDFPTALDIDGKRYRRIDGEDTFIFWDELRDQSKHTVGYTFLMPDNPIFVNARLWTESENATVENNEVRLLLQSCVEPSWECVQGFGSELYQSELDPQDCVLLMMDWSENKEAFQLHPGPGGKRIAAA